VESAIDFLIGSAPCLTVGLALELACRRARAPSWSTDGDAACPGLPHVLGAVPGWLSGHYGSYLDRLLDAMRG